MALADDRGTSASEYGDELHDANCHPHDGQPPFLVDAVE
jgi:hypothetical protein